MAHQERSYRGLIKGTGLISFRAVVKETDLWVRAKRTLEKETTNLILRHRMPLERYIRDHPDFVNALRPYPQDPWAPPIVRSMLAAAEGAGVGPMAAVAGAIAEYVGRDLLSWSDEVMVENGGDVFMCCAEPVTMGIFAGDSPLSNRVGIRIHSPRHPVGVCTSSGTVGHSASFGRADAVVVLSASAATADAAATGVCNRVTRRRDIKNAIAAAQEIPGLNGVVIIVGDEIGVWGDIELVRL
jgi:hypothetical protein